MDCTNNSLSIVHGDVVLGVHGSDFHYLFSYATGGLESLVLDGKEWLYRTPKPTFWRATTCNDRGNSFSATSNMWMGADMFPKCINITVVEDGKTITTLYAPENNVFGGPVQVKTISLTFTYQILTTPSTTVDVTYTVDATGCILVNVHYHGKQGLPELPVFGMRFVMPTKATGYHYLGLSGETYPDRKAGGILGEYEVDGLPVTPYLVPQDCGMHMDTQWVEVYRNTVRDNRKQAVAPSGIRISCIDDTFAFTCLPYTAQELENAYHQEDLPPARRTVLSILGAVRGIGGIDSWGAQVIEHCCINAEQDITYSFKISPALSSGK